MIKEIKLPEVGENVESGDIAKLLVSVGDIIEIDQPVLEFETDKAVVDVPSPFRGKVTEIMVKEGETISVGSVLLKVDVREGVAPEQEPEKIKPEAEQEKIEPPVVVSEEKEPEIIPIIPEKSPEDLTAIFSETEIEESVAAASPSVRRLARELGININRVTGSGPSGRISAEDVKNFTKEIVTRDKVPVSPGTGIYSELLPDFSKWGEIDIQPMTKVRKITAQHLSYAWTTIPHVTQFDKADITELEKVRKKYGERAKAAGGKLTTTAFLLKVIALALKKFPQVNSSIDMAKKTIIYKKYYNIGIAVDTERGLLVPVIRNVDRKNVFQLAADLTEIAEKARNRKLSPDDMSGGNFSISNLGGIGGTYFTPVINAPEVAILGVSRATMEPVFTNDQFVPRLLMPLSLSYDHRIVDGADAIRFLRWVVEALEQPFILCMEED